MHLIIVLNLCRNIFLWENHRLFHFHLHKIDPMIRVQTRNWLQENRHSERGSATVSTQMVDFNVMAEVGETPP